MNELKILFSSPIFGDMFLLETGKSNPRPLMMFSSPIFGDMFLLETTIQHADGHVTIVFVSYIRRYVLTIVKSDDNGNVGVFSSPIFGDMFLL